MNKFSYLFIGLFIFTFASLTIAQDEIIRATVNVPKVDPSAITLDGQANEAAWQNAARADLITQTGYNGWFNYYWDFGDAFTEPDYDDIYARMLWADDTLYVYIHVKEIITDSTDLYFTGGKFNSDQLFVGLSNRLGVNLQGWYDGNPYAAPNGPYHYWIMGQDVSLNGGDYSWIPDDYKCPGDTSRIFYASDYARWAVTTNPSTGLWTVEMAIYHPNITAGSSIGFNIGGSNAQSFENFNNPDDPDYTYSYWVWYPHVPNEPFTNPTGENDPGYYILVNSDYWPILTFSTGPSGGIEITPGNNIPEEFTLHQNYPNPFNPTTNIRFDVSKQSPVTLKIYNVVGQLVATLINNEIFDAGTYTVRWNAADLASGMYIYHLEAEGRTSSMKMMLLK
jgi:hypothetical protein